MWMDADPSRRVSGGFAFLEVLVVLLVGSALLGALLPRARQLQARRVASEVVDDVSVLRVAASAYHSDRGVWPPEIRGNEGRVRLAAYLPSGFSFQRDAYDLAWEHWALPDGLPPGGDSVSVVGVSIRTSVNGATAALSRALGPGVGRFTLGETTTFILDGL